MSVKQFYILKENFKKTKEDIKHIENLRNKIIRDNIKSVYRKKKHENSFMYNFNFHNNKS